jgi:ribonuclease P/MRP protein subunit POP5
MREKRRYILVRLDPPSLDIDGRDLYYAIGESLTSLYGDCGMARIQPSVVSFGQGYAIIRCTRSTEGQLSTGLAAVNQVQEKNVAVRSIRTSGTMRSLRQHLEGVKGSNPAGEQDVQFQGRSFTAVMYQGTKVDLFEKGFKNQELLFLTEDDLEE